ncbi:Rv3235 family protein [Actinoplanes xinjiangensis]|uniref:Rv3235 family protein n=1 Tax=Actinoplanes xinjiangensis TaxID=512350 RepID=UPI003443EEF5
MRSAVEMAPTGSGATIRLRPVPRYEPPFDDEATPQVWTSSRQLTLEWPADGPAVAPPPILEPPVVAGASGDAKLAVRRFVRLCVEVLNGFRPAAHLRRLALPSQAADVVAQGLAGARRAADLRKTRQPSARRPPVGVIKVVLCEPRAGAIEAAVTLVTGDRTWAMAFRLELHQQSWAATTLLII